MLHQLLDGLSRAADARDGLVLVLDEFQDVDRVDNIDSVLRSHLQHEHTAMFTNLPQTHRDTLRAIAAHGSPYSATAARALGLKKGSAQTAVKALRANGLVEHRAGGEWRIIDPLFASWLREVGT